MIYYELPTNSVYKRWPILVLRKSSQAQIGGCWDDWWNPGYMAHVDSFDVFPKPALQCVRGTSHGAHLFTCSWTVLLCFIFYLLIFFVFRTPPLGLKWYKINHHVPMFYFVISSVPYSQSWGNARNGKHIMKHAGWCPPVISWFINPMNTRVTSTILVNHSEVGVICTNLANELGHHLVIRRFPWEKSWLRSGDPCGARRCSGDPPCLRGAACDGDFIGENRGCICQFMIQNGDCSYDLPSGNLT